MDRPGRRWTLIPVAKHNQTVLKRMKNHIYKLKLHTLTHIETQTQTLTSELNLSWQTLHEMTCFFLGTKVTPKVWLMTAFCTGSIYRSQTEVRGQHAAQDSLNSDDRLMLTE